MKKNFHFFSKLNIWKQEISLGISVWLNWIFYFFSALTKEYIIENQPIGKKLFRQFCATNETYNLFFAFIEFLEKYELAEDDLQVINTLEKQLIETFLSSRSKLTSYLGGQFAQADLEELEAFSRAQNRAAVRDLLLNKFQLKISQLLYAEPFEAFLDSIYFMRYLQIKNLEKLPVTKNSFRMYRVLGKGGFGEVCACQSRATGRMYACKKLEKKRIKKRKGELMALNEKQILERVNSR